MKRLILIMAVWLLPVSANAQLRLDFDADAYYDAPQASASVTADHPPSTTETSPDKARAVRHGERTVMLANGVSAAPGNKAKLAAARNPY